ncbi:MAG TPA: RodZ domain-containing protein [Ramlibacter sp.]|jgi:cytoskeleton protein RodZ|uniref:helix-turn-helix domain-containing protein n=1 Tax=Ramlibacter sp. TaxID=1917967 RepID=UPI002D676F1C|nr:RodZ domain-containing protein [Ramlibacter sp.]HZY18663.1 RodZ domain-containing protein [Ramlibacter sp.]
MSEVGAAGPTAGAQLRRAREAAGLHVAALAATLKVPVRKLEALEDDRYDLLPDAVFARALASSVCRTLKIDPQPVLSQLPQSSTPRLAPAHEGINAPFRAPGDAPGPKWYDQLMQPVFLSVFALLLGALILIFLPSLRRDETPASKPESAEVAAGAPVLPPGSPTTSIAPAEPLPAGIESAAAPARSASATMAVQLAAPTPVVAPATAAAPGTAAAAAANAPAVALPPAVAASAPATAASGAAGPKPPANGVVVFKTTGPSWIEVTDSKGTVTLRRLMAAGEAAGASGSLPLTVTVGSASDTAVEVRGKPFNLGAVSRDNVARFEVK